MFFSDREKIQRTIFKAEMLAESIGAPISEILKKYSDELRAGEKNTAEKISLIVSSLRSGKKRWDAYGKVIDPDVSKLLRMADEKSLSPGAIIRAYVPAKELSVKYKNGLKRSLKNPIGVFFAVTFTLGYVVQNFSSMVNSGTFKVNDFTIFVMNNFYLINFIFITLVTIPLVYSPEKMPILKKVFTRLDSILALASIEALLAIGYSTADAIPQIKKQFNIDFEPKKRNINGLIDLLLHKKFIDHYEAAEIKILTKEDDSKEAIRRIVRDRIDESKNMSEDMTKLVMNLSIVFSIVPFLLLLVVFGDVMLSAVSLASGGGMGN